MIQALTILALVGGGLLRVLGASRLSNRLFLFGIALAVAVPFVVGALGLLVQFAGGHEVVIALTVFIVLMAGAMTALKGKGARPERLTLKKRIDA